jgi:hypothetical protein
MPRQRLPLASAFNIPRGWHAALAAVLATSAACSPSGKPPETPETPASTGEGEKPEPPAPSAEPSAEPSSTSGQPPPPDPNANVPKGMAIDAYEMTPADCNALGRHYGEVARRDQMAQLSPKLSEKQRAATTDQIDKVVGTMEERWTSGCHASLVNRAVDQATIKCALAAKTVKDFDVCINGPGGTPQPVGKPSGKKKK